MTRVVSLLTALVLLFLNGTASVRACACLDAMSKPACCAKDMPCCDGDDCKVHTEPTIKAELAFDLFKVLDSLSALVPIGIPLPSQFIVGPDSINAPAVVRVRGPDIRYHSLRAPPHQA